MQRSSNWSGKIVKFLLINTAGVECMVSVFKAKSGITYESKSYGKNNHSEMLFAAIDEVLNAATLTYQDITNIAACVGPGSFTGLRASLAAVQGLKLASGVSVHGISLLELQAYFIFRALEKNDMDILSVVHTIQKEPSDRVFYQVFSKSLIPQTDFGFCARSELPQGKYAAAGEADSTAIYSAKFAGEYLVHKLSNALPETPLTPIYSRNYG